MSPDNRAPDNSAPESGPPESGSAESASSAGRSRGAKTADRVLAAALEVYAAHGFEGFTITAVIAESGVSSGSIYHHFGNLDGLCAALYWRCMARLLDELTDGLAAVRPAPDDAAAAARTPDERSAVARAGVEALVQGYLRFVRDNRAAAHFIHASSYARFLTAPAGEATTSPVSTFTPSRTGTAAPSSMGASAAAGTGGPVGAGGTGGPVGAGGTGGPGGALDGDAKPPRMERILGWFRPFVEGGQIVDLPESLLEILVIGPVSEISRRWLAGAPGHDLDLAAQVLPEHIWRSIQTPPHPPSP